MARYYLDNQLIHDAFGDELSDRTPDIIYHLSADGTLQNVTKVPDLADGEGLLIYAGDFYIQPLEVKIEFIKAANGEKWLEGLLQRHAERVRAFSNSLWVIAEIKEVSHES